MEIRKATEMKTLIKQQIQRKRYWISYPFLKKLRQKINVKKNTLSARL